MSVLLNNFITYTKYCVKFNKTSNFLWAHGRGYCGTASLNVDANSAAPTPQTPTVAERSSSSKKHRQKQHQQHQQSLQVAVIGVPNAGKSTFINNLINHRVCPTSNKVHTTRKANKAIYTTDQTQLIFYDTPGLVTPNEIKRHNLDQSFKSAYRHAIQNADIIAVMHDVSNSWTRNSLHSTVLDTLHEYMHLPSFLILNKIDALKSKRLLLELIRKLTNDTLTSPTTSGRRKPRVKAKTTDEKETPQQNIEQPKEQQITSTERKEKPSSWSNFQEVFLVSSITGSGLNDIHDFLVDSAKDHEWQYPSDIFTDASPETLIVESVRARLLDYLPQEVPYTLHCSIEYYSVEKDTIYTSVVVTCPSPRIERLICGVSNGKFRQITERVTSDLVETFGKPISLTITTRSKKNN